ncbi:outer membrane protein assembly factor BamE [Buchnera aphidicola (Acyrthosiphon lactucae)]|uniref:Outer membrane protein assembly factor BamE n=1 Tax=Buchnera aphidicola (Acyrthosiphon lactucae) TaxID=1241832 RepID=A0A4D6XVG6_9GAMM|nr:outer membrane protein assembly factor BamE [Buchnera aphidicola]QCI17591.1 outer membrane protein assembly factor BamE [Buchnera aphidicola (Acyrthosiphon lactucae)]
MNNYIKILLIVICFSSCSVLDKKENSNFLDKIYFNKNILNQNYVGMTRKQIVYIFGMPIISDSFSDVYHYYLYDLKNNNTSSKVMLNLYFKDNKVEKFNIT